MATTSVKTWSVKLNPNHTPYNICNFKRELPNNLNYTVVIVDTERFMECYHNEMKCYVIATADKWTHEKREGIRDFLDPNTGAPHMPRIGFVIRERKRLWGLIKPETFAVVSFTNGRHRSRYLQYAGAKCFPVEVHTKQAPLLLQYCGCQS